MYIKKFLKNSFLMFLGQSIIFLLAFVITGVYAYTLGKEGFGIIGIVSSFIMIIASLDISFFLSFVISINKFKKYKKEDINKMIESVFFVSWLSNIFLIPLLMVLSYWLCTKIYSVPNLFNYFLINIATFALTRVSSLLLMAVRVFQKEKWVQIAQVVSYSSGIALIICLLIFSNLWLYSVFIGGLFSAVICYIFSVYFIKKLGISLKPRISFRLIKQLFKGITGYDYSIKIFRKTVIYGGVLISSIFLTITQLGMLTAVMKIIGMAYEFIDILPVQLSIIFLPMLQKKDYKRIKKVSLLISNLSITIFGLVFIFLFTIGDYFASLYLGDVYNSYVFKIVITGFLLEVSFIAFNISFCLSNIAFFSKIRIVSTLFFVILAIFFSKFFGLTGVAVLIALTFIISTIILIILSFRKFNVSFREIEFDKLFLSLFLISVYFFVSSKGILVNLSIFLALSIIYITYSFKSFKGKLKLILLI